MLDGAKRTPETVRNDLQTPMASGSDTNTYRRGLSSPLVGQRKLAQIPERRAASPLTVVGETALCQQVVDMLACSRHSNSSLLLLTHAYYENACGLRVN
jgi:hypothetical protein